MFRRYVSHLHGALHQNLKLAKMKQITEVIHFELHHSYGYGHHVKLSHYRPGQTQRVPAG